MTEFRTAHGPRKRVSLDFFDDDGEPLQGRTKQSFKDQCDINCILRNYDKTGLITHVNDATARYGDFTEVNEYQDSLNLVIEADRAFSELPSHVRKRFGNDPGAFFEFATDPDNFDQMVELGLANPPVVEPAFEQPSSEPVSEPTVAE